MKNIFDKVSEAVFNELKSGEEVTLNLTGEDQSYVRFNGGKIRQNTHVVQNEISLLYKNDGKVVNINWSLIEDAEISVDAALKHLNRGRAAANNLPKALQAPKIENNGSSEVNFESQIPAVTTLIPEVSETVKNLDFCGVLAMGPQIFGSRNSKGQSHWFSRDSFFVDYSLYSGDRAIKGVYSDLKWNSQKFSNKIADSTRQLNIMERPVQKIKPAAYRVYLEPAAVLEMVQFLSWTSLGQKAFETGQGLFGELARGRKNFNTALTIRENFDLGFSPLFNSLGEVSPHKVPLIENGKFTQFLTSSLSAQEFKVPCNQASMQETPRSLEILPGQLKLETILSQLGTGLYIGNLHYINASDQKSARITGMTRFGCFWVQNGEIVGPIENLRFDESLYEAWGANLLGLTENSEILPEVATYSARALGGYKLPGMLIDNFHFTL